MGWKALLNLDMAGQFAKWRAIVDADHADHLKMRGVYCMLQSASEFDHTWGAIAVYSYWHFLEFRTGSEKFYHAGKFSSEIKARANIESEIRRATKRHPQTTFFRTKEVAIVEGSDIRNERGWELLEGCKDGVWYIAKWEELHPEDKGITLVRNHCWTKNEGATQSLARAEDELSLKTPKTD